MGIYDIPVIYNSRVSNTYERRVRPWARERTILKILNIWFRPHLNKIVFPDMVNVVLACLAHETSKYL